ncbi:Inner membrane protein YohD [Adhaeretor mobilis]|uniref:Inner membrane protein YohD n=1 Tax=Adhaeretor mobilis TaxID=1930276 RepID=A0A517MSP0_9BACT|nr:Inner membrane protein YohD [Adhaeretor mobilis]
MIASLFHPGSYLGIILFLVLTGCGMPIPEEVAIVIAGVLSSQGKLEPELAFGACLLGALLGDAVMYAIGYHFGHTLMAKHPKLSKLIGASKEEQFENAVTQHGFKVLMLSRFMVGIRGPVYLAAGTVRMPFRKFLAWDLIAATSVVGLFFSVSYVWGEPITEWIKSAEWYLTLVVLLVVGLVTLFLLRRNRKRMLERMLEEDEQQESPEAISNDADEQKREAS